jgi:hypothetical protein
VVQGGKIHLEPLKTRREAEFSAAVQVVQDDLYFFIHNHKISKFCKFLEPINIINI